MHLRWKVTFEDDPGEDTRAGEPHPLTWEDDEGTGEPSDWYRPEERPEEDLGCLPALNPLIQEFLSGDVPWAGKGTEDNPWQTSTPEPSHRVPMNGLPGVCSSWTCQPGCRNSGRFPARMTSGNLPERCRHHFNYQRWVAIPPKWRMTTLCHQHPTPWTGTVSCPSRICNFGGQDFWLKQPQKTLAYAKALQPWSGKAQPPTPGKPCWLVESVLELQCDMDPLMTFADEEVLEDLQPPIWVRITPSRSVEPTPRECSCSRTHRAHARGTFSTAYGEGWPKAMTSTQTVSKPGATAQEVELKQEDTVHWWPSSPPGFVEIAWSLQGDNPPKAITGVPP